MTIFAGVIQISKRYENHKNQDGSGRAGQADLSGPINYRQMYAQALAELERGDTYWFTGDDEVEIARHNQPYQQCSSVEEILHSLYQPGQHKKDFFLTTTDIQQQLRERLMPADVPTLHRLGLALRRQHFPSGSSDGVHGYYLQVRGAG